MAKNGLQTKRLGGFQTDLCASCLRNKEQTIVDVRFVMMCIPCIFAL